MAIKILNYWAIFRINLRQIVRRLPSKLTMEEKHDLEVKRQRLAIKIQGFHTMSSRFLGAEVVANRLGGVDEIPADGYVSDDFHEAEGHHHSSNLIHIENSTLVFPSSVSGHLSDSLIELRNKEMQLRRGKANDTLGRLRESLSGLSYQYINKLRQASTTKDHLKSYRGIKLLTKEVSFYQQVYNRNRAPLIRLDGSLMTRYPYLRKEECRINTAIADVNGPGQSQARLAWFWGAFDGYDKDMAKENTKDPGVLLECRCLYS
ncbi:MAG: hypothetical protein QOH50_5047 [Kribbellaceae bacterium]|nr:hypothetical protein [Kribbellaceae bacterium]